MPDTPEEVRELLEWSRTNPKHADDNPSMILCYLTEECAVSRAVVREQLVAIGWTEALEAHDKVTAELEAAGAVLR
jgi:hypothetical protein